MSDYRNLKLGAEGVAKGGRGFQVVPLPARTDGIGEALRKVFGRRAETCPDDIETLLKKLDAKSRTAR